MNTIPKVLIVAILIITAVTITITRKNNSDLSGAKGDITLKNPIALAEEKDQVSNQERTENGNYFVNDTLFRWDLAYNNWVPTLESLDEYEQQLGTLITEGQPADQPVKITWDMLTEIRYRLRYFSQMEMEILAPVFPNSIKALNGREVIIEGFVIPFDVEQEILSLSANPMSSCFFCGLASPASIISMYLENDRKRYKMDVHKEFRGKLYLNYDDPNQFYYILREAIEE